MIELGAAHDCRTVAVLTAMDRPLGWACGSALETEEAIHALRGEGPPDLMAVTFALAAEMLASRRDCLPMRRALSRCHHLRGGRSQISGNYRGPRW